MKKCNHKALIFTASGLGLITVILAVMWFFSLRFNYTGSAPVGFYRELSGDPAHGDYVMVDMTGIAQAEELADRGQIRRYEGSILLCKKVVGKPGDIVDRDAQGVLSVNGVSIPNSAAFIQDNDGNQLNPVNIYPYTIKDDECLVMGVSAHSFDGRYTGPIKNDRIKSRVQIVWSWGNSQ